MKNNKIAREDKKSFFSGKGFYITLALSIIAVGAAAWIGVNSSLDKLSNDNDDIKLEDPVSQIVEKKEWDIPTEQEKPVVKPESDLPAKAPSEAKPNDNLPQGYIMPVNGDILTAYSGDKVVKSKTLDEWVMHTGMDIAAKQSTPVKAVSGGKVIDIKNDAMWGACIIIEHGDGVQSHYYNLKTAISVKKNQIVKLGDVIGAVGSSADIESAEESHLHFAMKKNGNWVDPMTLIKIAN